jgi:RNA polymerase primary sigma factor
LLEKGDIIRESFNKNKDKLSERERIILELRYGLRTGKPSTLEDVGEILCLSKQRVSAICGIALNKIGFMRVKAKPKDVE